MKKRIAILLIVLLLLVGFALLSSCSPIETTPQQSDLLMREVNARATARAASLEAQKANLDADAYQTARNALAQQATSEAGRVIVEQSATSAEINRQAVAAATDQAWQIVEWTASADTAKSNAVATRTQESWEFTKTAVVSDAQSTQTARKADEDRSAMTNQFLAWLPYALIVLCAMAIFAVGTVALVKYWKRPQVIYRDARGDAPLMIGNGDQVFDMDRNPGAIMRLLPGGAESPQLATPEIQERTTERDQAIDLTTRGLAGQSLQNRIPARTGAAAGAQPPSGMPDQMKIKIYGPDETPKQLLKDPDTLRVLDGVWLEEGEK